MNSPIVEGLETDTAITGKHYPIIDLYVCGQYCGSSSQFRTGRSYAEWYAASFMVPRKQIKTRKSTR